MQSKIGLLNGSDHLYLIYDNGIGGVCMNVLIVSVSTKV